MLIIMSVQTRGAGLQPLSVILPFKKEQGISWSDLTPALLAGNERDGLRRPGSQAQERALEVLWSRLKKIPQALVRTGE